MNDNPTPSALAIRRATRLRELQKMTTWALRVVLKLRLKEAAVDLYSDLKKEQIIDEILHLEGLDLEVLR